MKKSLIALASMAALAGAAHADVTLYGVIDASFTTVSAGGSTDGNNPANVNVLNSYGAAGSGSTVQGGSATGNGRVTGMANGVLQASRWGIKGSEDLGQGLKANFVLESGLNIAAGTNPNDHLFLANNAQTTTGSGDSTLNGQMFDRQSTVGLQGDFGRIDAGYQLNVTGDMTGLNDPFNGGYISPLGFYGGLTGGGSSATGRQSNSVKYAYSMGPSTIKAFYAMGGISGNAGQGSQLGLGVNLQLMPTLQINFSASRMNDDVSFGSASTGGYAASTTNSAGATTTTGAIAGTAPALSASYYNSIENLLGVVWQATPVLQVKGGYLTETLSNPANPVGDATVTQVLGVPINPNKINTAPYSTNTTRTIAWIGGTYDLTTTSHLTAAYYQETLGAYLANVTSNAAVQQAYSSNTAQIFAVAYKFDLSKRTDIYVAANYESWDTPGALNKTVTSSTGVTNLIPINQTTSAGTTQSMFAVGLRTKF